MTDLWSWLHRISTALDGIHVYEMVRNPIPAMVVKTPSRCPVSRCASLAAAGLVLISATFAAVAEFPGAEWPKSGYAAVGLAEARLQQVRDYALTGGGSG